jgi:hypothetical protein
MDQVRMIFKHAQNRTCYRIPTPHERNKDNRILKVTKEPEKPSSYL